MMFGVRADVMDEGIGIAPDQLTRVDDASVYERFYQVGGSSTRRFGGTGLVLEIVDGTARAHGGTIKVTSEVGAGSTFSFALPAVLDGIAPQAEPCPATAGRTTNQNKTHHDGARENG